MFKNAGNKEARQTKTQQTKKRSKQRNTANKETQLTKKHCKQRNGATQQFLCNGAYQRPQTLASDSEKESN